MSYMAAHTCVWGEFVPSFLETGLQAIIVSKFATSDELQWCGSMIADAVVRSDVLKESCLGPDLAGI